MDSGFHIHLASNVAPNTFPNNNASDFKTPLAEEIHLEGGEWEVAVKDIMYPSEVSSTSESDKIFFHRNVWSFQREIPFKELNGTYIPHQEILDTTNLRKTTVNVGKALANVINQSTLGKKKIMECIFEDNAFSIDIFSDIVVIIDKQWSKYMRFPLGKNCFPKGYHTAPVFNNNGKMPLNSLTVTVYDCTVLKHVDSVALPLEKKDDKKKDDKKTLVALEIPKVLRVKFLLEYEKVEIEILKTHNYRILQFPKGLVSLLAIQPFHELPRESGQTKILLITSNKQELLNRLKTWDNKWTSFKVYGTEVLAGIESGMKEKPDDLIELHANAKFLSPKDFLPMLNSKNKAYNCEFTFDNDTSRFHLEIKGDYAVKMTKSLAGILGFSFKGFEDLVSFDEKKLYKAIHPAFLNRGIEHLFVYSNIVDSVFIGDTKAPLLLACPFKRELYGNIHQEFLNPTYVPLNRRSIHQIDIYICDGSGDVIPFLFGKTVLNLHFRKCIS